MAESREFAQFGGVLALAAQAVEELISRQKTEEQLELREKFFSLISHDLRTPLTVAQTNAALISKNSENPAACLKAAARIIEAVKQADQLICDLLDVNRLKEGMRLPLQVASCDLKTTTQKVLDELSTMYGSRFELDCKESILAVIDNSAIRRALTNLISNAVKYGDLEKPISVQIKDIGSFVQIGVHNYGNPISAEELSSLSQWHYRTASAIQSGKQGWGLGLMLVKGIAEAHDGTVSVSSSADQGTCFAMNLPHQRTN